MSLHTQNLRLHFYQNPHFITDSLRTSLLLKRTTNSKILCPSNMHRNWKQFSTLAIEEVAITAVRCARIKPKNNQYHPNVQSFFLLECQIPYKARVGYKWVNIHIWPSLPLHQNPHFNHRLAQHFSFVTGDKTQLERTSHLLTCTETENNFWPPRLSSFNSLK